MRAQGLATFPYSLRCYVVTARKNRLSYARIAEVVRADWSTQYPHFSIADALRCEAEAARFARSSAGIQAIPARLSAQGRSH